MIFSLDFQDFGLDVCADLSKYRYICVVFAESFF